MKGILLTCEFVEPRSEFRREDSLVLFVAVGHTLHYLGYFIILNIVFKYHGL